jgi:putative hydrolase of the HAD superfamily
MVQRCRGDDVESVLRPEALQAIEQARALGAKLAVLSNELDMFYGAGFAKRLPLLRDFDVVVDATYTGILKPDPRAYEAVQLALDLPAHACVFLDDQAKNIRGALSAGWQAIELDVRHPALAYDQAIERLNAMRSI